MPDFLCKHYTTELDHQSPYSFKYTDTVLGFRARSVWANVKYTIEKKMYFTVG